jgi:signal peptidase I
MQGKRANRNANVQRRHDIITWPLYVLLVLMLALYILFQRVAYISLVAGILVVVLIVALLVIEIANASMQKKGRVRNIAEIVLGIAIVVALWFGLQAVLATSHPLDVVPSCSMLPYLQRGDMILLQGVHNISQIKAPVVDVTQEQVAALEQNLSRESLECVAYLSTPAGTYVSQFVRQGYSVGLLYSSSSGSEIVPGSFQDGNLVRYTCGTTSVLFTNGTIMQEAYTKSITIGNTTITGDANNTVLVYGTVPGDLFYSYGDAYIVHRVYAVLRTSSNYYVLTKGDNNPGLDLQYGNYPANSSEVQGKVIASIPYLGYLKLAISGSFTEPTGCNYTTQG